jgi:hypothetical protein
MPDLAKIGELAVKLKTLTEQDKVKWSETADESIFNSSLPQFQVSIAKRHMGQNWGEDVYGYFITVRDLSGRVLDEAGDSDFGSAVTGEAGAGLEFTGVSGLQILKDLYDLARRRALGVDKALSALLSSLDRI